MSVSIHHHLDDPVEQLLSHEQFGKYGVGATENKIIKVAVL